MDFLRSLWPELKKKALQHDSYCCKTYTHSLPFPSQRLPNYQHVGQVFDKDDLPRMTDIDPYLRDKPNPPKCRARADWIYG